MGGLWIPDVAWWQLVVRAVVVFVAVLLLLRVSGKRQVGQMGVAQFVALLLISNAVQNAMNGGDNSLGGGLILAGALIVLSYVFEVLTYRSKRFETLVQGRPTLLVHHGKVLTEHLHRELLNERELRAILRHQGIRHLDEVQEAILESDGYVSLVRKTEG
ncbi:MAG: DUF421 domain-containing protein [Planctomycetes bacterium]|nr:DUF421 domain-containing protein [Planctomycetota bacterium]